MQPGQNGALLLIVALGGVAVQVLLAQRSEGDVAGGGQGSQGGGEETWWAEQAWGD